jgi:hypothetical protein
VQNPLAAAKAAEQGVLKLSVRLLDHTLALSMLSCGGNVVDVQPFAENFPNG